MGGAIFQKEGVKVQVTAGKVKNTTGFKEIIQKMTLKVKTMTLKVKTMTPK
jgi:hypothetical protein